MELMPAAEPKQGEAWMEKDGGAVFTVKNVDRWKSGAVTVHAIHVPLMRMWTGPLESFIDKFERKAACPRR